MRFTVSREKLVRPITLATGVVEKKQTKPILANVLVSLSDGQLSFTGTDMEIEVVVRISVEDGQSGLVTLPGKKLFDICRALPDDATVDLSVDNERAILRSGRSRFVLSTLPASDFPNVQDISQIASVELPQNVLRKCIEKTQFAMAQQDVRFYLNGLLLELAAGYLRTVATDGHRLALCDHKIKTNIKENQQVIIPRKGVGELYRLLEDSDKPAQVTIATNHIRVATDDVTFTSKLVDGRFPDYQRVIPQGGDKEVIVERESLRQAVGRASILSNERYRSLRVVLTPGSLKVIANNPENEEAEEEVPVNYEGEKLEIGFNATYLGEALNAIGEANVHLTLADPNSCCLLHGEGNSLAKFVVMPMRI